MSLTFQSTFWFRKKCLNVQNLLNLRKIWRTHYIQRLSKYILELIATNDDSTKIANIEIIILKHFIFVLCSVLSNNEYLSGKSKKRTNTYYVPGLLVMNVDLLLLIKKHIFIYIFLFVDLFESRLGRSFDYRSIEIHFFLRKLFLWIIFLHKYFSI